MFCRKNERRVLSITYGLRAPAACSSDGRLRFPRLDHEPASRRTPRLSQFDDVLVLPVPSMILCQYLRQLSGQFNGFQGYVHFALRGSQVSDAESLAAHRTELMRFENEK